MAYNKLMWLFVTWPVIQVAIFTVISELFYRVLRVLIRCVTSPNNMSSASFVCVCVGQEFIMAARQRKMSTPGNYVISSDIDSIHRHGQTFVGRMRWQCVVYNDILFTSSTCTGWYEIDVAKFQRASHRVIALAATAAYRPAVLQSVAVKQNFLFTAIGCRGVVRLRSAAHCCGYYFCGNC